LADKILFVYVKIFFTVLETKKKLYKLRKRILKKKSWVTGKTKVKLFLTKINFFEFTLFEFTFLRKISAIKIIFKDYTRISQK